MSKWEGRKLVLGRDLKFLHSQTIDSIVRVLDFCATVSINREDSQHWIGFSECGFLQRVT